MDFEQCKKILQDVELAEIRLDKLDFSLRQVEEIFSLPGKWIATCRPGRISESERRDVLTTAVEAGAAYVDIEIEADDFFIKTIIDVARKKKCRVIMSYHNFENTPAKTELPAIVNRCLDRGADIAKIACRVLSEADSARILSLYDSPAGAQGKILALGMGEKGKITRVAAPFLGAPFTFSALSPGQKTAPGQLDIKTMQKIFNLVKP
jgi:3-dehydroquinate dehydratase-1